MQCDYYVGLVESNKVAFFMSQYLKGCKKPKNDMVYQNAEEFEILVYLYCTILRSIGPKKLNFWALNFALNFAQNLSVQVRLRTNLSCPQGPTTENPKSRRPHVWPRGQLGAGWCFSSLFGAAVPLHAC